MNNFKKVFLFLIACLIFFVLFFITFFQKSNTQILQREKIFIQDGIFSLLKKENTYEQSPSNSGSSFQIDRFGIFHSLFFSQNSRYTRDNSDTNTTRIQITSGDFLLDVGDPTHTIFLDGTGFKAQIIGGGRIYIHKNPLKKTTFFSLDSVIKIILVGNNDNTVKTEVYLYPHMLFSFDPKRNNFLSNADRIRVSTVHDFDYIYESISKAESSSFVNTLSAAGFSSQFLSDTISYQQILLSESQKYISAFISAGSKFQIPGYHYIQKYTMLFLNETKRKAYLKSLILEQFLILIKNDVFDTGAYIQMKEYFSQGEMLDEKEFQDFRNELKPIVFYFLQSPDLKNIETKQQLLLLFSENNTFDFNKNGVHSAMILSSIYRQFDIGDGSQNYYSGIASFIDRYLADIGIKDTIKNNNNQLKKTYALDYLIFFLEKILVPKELNFSDANFPALVNILDTYNTLSYIIYGTGDESLAKTALYVHLNLSQKIVTLLDILYFQNARDSRNLLVRKEDNSVSSDTIKMLSKNIDYIYRFFLDNKKFLADDLLSKDSTLPTDYENMYTLYQEYAAALLDYNAYLIEYDSLKKSLLDVKDFNTDQNTSLSKEKFRQYFSQFVGFDLTHTQITVYPQYYEAQDVMIGGSKFSFDFYPSNSNEISNIVINGTDRNVSYKLDIVEQSWKKALETAQRDEIDKYKFENFFLLTFLNKKESQVVEIFENTNNTQQEDPVIRVFKLNKLLSKKEGLWRNISHLEFKYDAVEVSLKNQTPDISIQNTLFQKTMVSNGYTWQVYADFSGKFILDTTSNYFKDIQMRIYKNYLQDTKAFHFGNTFIQVIGNIDIVTASQQFDKLGEALARIQYIESELSSLFPLANLDIKYFLGNDKIIMKFSSKGESVSLYITGDRVDSFNFSGKNILNNTIQYTQLRTSIP